MAHGYAAYRNGDDTAFKAGRLTLNPISHIDFIGSIIVPIFAYLSFGIPFGWAKPVPYNPENVRHKKYAVLEISAAGVLMNFFLALISFVVFKLMLINDYINQDLFQALFLVTVVNVMLACFNLLPFPPADGFKIFKEISYHVKGLFIYFKNLFFKTFKKNGNYANFRNTSSFEDYHNRKGLISSIENIVSGNIIFIIISIYISVQVFGLISDGLLSLITKAFIY